MLEVLVDHGNGCRICVGDDPQGCVPYPPGRSRFDVNTGYLPIKNEPSLIDGLHEVRQLPALGPILREINGTDSLLESIGCGPGQFKRKKDPGKCFAGAYVHVIFSCAPLNFVSANHRAIALNFGEAWAKLPGVGIDVIIDPLSHFWGWPGAWALKFEVAGQGDSFREAWERAVPGLHVFLSTLKLIDVRKSIAQA